MKNFNVLYQNINYRENSQYRNYIKLDDIQKEKYLKDAEEIVKFELDGIIDKEKVDVIIFTEAYPLNESSSLLKYLRENDYTVFPYDDSFNEYMEMNNDTSTFKDDKTASFIPFKRAVQEVVSINYVQNAYSNSIIIAAKKEYGFKVNGYKIDNPNFLSIENDDLCLIGTRICFGYEDLSDSLKSKLNHKALESINLSYENKSICVFNEDKKDKVNDYTIRRANFEYIKEKYNNSNSNGKKTIVIGDFNISERFIDFPIWNYKNIVENDNRFKVCRDNTIGNSKMDYIYTDLHIDKNDFISYKTVEEIYIKEEIQKNSTNVISNINSPFPDHNLLFARFNFGNN